MRTYLCVAAVLSASGLAMAQDEIIRWNSQLLGAIASNSVAPPMATRMMAMVHTAQYEAVNSVVLSHAPYVSTLPCPAGTNANAAAAVAGHKMMSHLFPAQQAQWDAELATQLAAIPNSQSKLDGIQLGLDSSAAMISLRSGDGWNNTLPPYTGGTNVGQWRPTPPGNQPAALPHWRNVTPWSVNSATQFKPGPAPSVTSAEYTTAYNEVKELGAKNSATRTQYQTDTANLWAANAGSVTPPGQWNQIAQQASAHKNLSMVENARLFALLGISLADAGITAWETKNSYDVWRPITGINEGENDGNPLTAGDPSWEPLLTTPNHQSYTSGHSTFSASAAALLSAYFGTSAIPFELTGDGVTRQFNDFILAAEEAGMSRIFGGIHWQFDNTEGLWSGSSVGAWVFANELVVPAPSTGALALALGLVAARRRRNNA